MTPPPSPKIPDERLQELTDDIREAGGDRLVGVGYHFKGDWRPLYRRDDFKERFTSEQQERMAKDTIMEGLAKRVRESAWGFGELRYTISGYADAIVIHVPFSETEGIVVGVDVMTPDEIHGIADRCLAYRDALR